MAADGEAAAPVTAEAVNDFMRVDAITQSFLWQYSEPIAGCDLSVLSVLLPVGAPARARTRKAKSGERSGDSGLLYDVVSQRGHPRVERAIREFMKLGECSEAHSANGLLHHVLNHCNHCVENGTGFKLEFVPVERCNVLKR